jgi:ABC-type sugar transport system ATPase subunit
VSHRLDEIFELSDRVTVFRDGKHVATSKIAEMSKEKLIQQMVGRELSSTDAHLGSSRGWMRINADARSATSRARASSDVSFTVAAGEIVGMAGLVGAGRSEALHLR